MSLVAAGGLFFANSKPRHNQAVARLRARPLSVHLHDNLVHAQQMIAQVLVPLEAHVALRTGQLAHALVHVAHVSPEHGGPGESAIALGAGVRARHRLVYVPDVIVEVALHLRVGGEGGSGGRLLKIIV